MTRVPHHREFIYSFAENVVKESGKFLASNPDYLRQAIEKCEDWPTVEEEINLEKFQEFVLGDEYEIIINHGFSLRKIATSFRFALIFYKMSWHFL